MLLALPRAHRTDQDLRVGAGSQRLNPGLEELLSFISEVEKMISSVGGAS